MAVAGIPLVMGDGNTYVIAPLTLGAIEDMQGAIGDYRAGVDRTALAQMMFGRGAGDLTQLMRLTNKEIEEGARVAKELGLIAQVEALSIPVRDRMMARARAAVADLHLALSNLQGWEIPRSACINFSRENV
jgi:hypothetical protein